MELFKDLQQREELAKRSYLGKPEQFVAELQSSTETGLSIEEHAKRLELYGANRLEEKKKESLLSKLLNQFKDVMVLLLLFAALVSGFHGDIVEAVVIFAIVTINAVLGIIQEGNAEKALEALKKMSAPQARVLRGGEQSLVPAESLVLGDIVLLEAGDVVPADIRLLESSNMKVEEASLTGESVPVEKEAGFVAEEGIGIGDRHNMLYSSTNITYGRGTGIVLATAGLTEMGKIADKLQSIEEEATPLQVSLDKLGKMLALLCVVICMIVFVQGISSDLPSIFKGQFDEEIFARMTESLKISVSLAVAAVPEGLAAIVTIVLALGMKRMAERNAIVKRLLAVETLGCVDVICSDKTGTLTQNAMTVTRLYADREDYTVTGIGYAPEGHLVQDGQVRLFQNDGEQMSASLRLLLQVGLYCNDAMLKKDEQGHYGILGDPTEAALLTVAEKLSLKKQNLPKVWDLPFDSDRKMMSVCYENKANFSASQDNPFLSFTKGAPDIVLDRCTKLYTEQGIVPLTEEKREEIAKQNLAYAKNALRVLAFAFKPYAEESQAKAKESIENAEKDLVFVGLMGMIDPARPDAKAAISVCTKAGIRAVMITGDYKETAVEIARELGLYHEGDGALMGVELDKMSEEELRQAVEHTSVFARVSPEHKVRIVAALKANGHIASMTGDGVNDAPALKQADIGVGMGITGTEVVKGAADMILMDDNFASIVKAVEEGRVIYSNIRKFVGFLLSCNVGEILVIFLATMIFGFSPLESIQLLWLNLITDSFPALALGQEKADADIMDRKPRSRKEPIINREMLASILVQSLAITVAVLGVFALNYKGEESVKLAKTMAFSTLIFAELLRAYSSRSERFTIFEIGVMSNKNMVLATGLSFLMLLVVLYVPFLNSIFKTLPLGLEQWGQVLAFGIIPFLAGETYKLFQRLFKK